MQTVGIALIARNVEKTINDCVESFINHVDQCIVVKAGASTDKTPEILDALKGKYPDKLELYDFEWCDDFSAARNFSFSKLKTDWLLWCDADDTIIHPENIRELIKGAEDKVGAIWFPYDYAHDEFGNVTTVYERERLLRGSLNWVWKGRLHETVSALQEGKFVRTDLVKMKHNHTAGLSRGERNFKLLKVMLEEDPNDRRIWLYLGHQHFASQEWLESAEWYLKFGTDLKAIPIERYQALCYCSKAMREMEDRQGIDVALNAIELFPNYRDAYLELAHCYNQFGDYDKAIHYAHLSEIKGLVEEPPHIIFINPLEYTFNKYVMLSQCYLHKNQFENSLKFMELAYQVRPIEEVQNNIKYLNGIIRHNKITDSMKILAVELLDNQELIKLEKLPEIAPFWFKDTEEYTMLQGGVKHFTKDMEEVPIIHETNPNSVLVNIANVRKPEELLDKMDEKYNKVTIICPMPQQNLKQLNTYSQRDLEEMVASNPKRRILNLQKETNRVYCEYTNIPPSNIKVRMYVGQGLEYWSPRTIKENGCGGSETSAAWLCKELATRGCYPIIYAMDNQVWDGVVYRHFSTFNPASTDCHLFISSRVPDVYNNDIPSFQKWLWFHDIHCWDKFTPEIAERINCIVALSHWHANHLKRVYPWMKDAEIIDMDNNKVPYDDLWWPGQTYHPDAKLSKVPPIAIIGDAIDTQRFKAQTETKIPHRFIWCSSPDRGLEEVLNLWPLLKEKLPDAELKIFYGWEYFNSTLYSPEQRIYKQKIRNLIKQDGIEWCGRIGQEQLAKELQRAGCMLYPPPHQFRETYGIAFLEAQAAGVLCFYRMNGALGETIGNRGIPLAMDLTPQQVVDKIVETLRDKKLCDIIKEKGKKYAMKRTWGRQAEKFLLLYRRLEHGQERCD